MSHDASLVGICLDAIYERGGPRLGANTFPVSFLRLQCAPCRHDRSRFLAPVDSRGRSTATSVPTPDHRDHILVAARERPDTPIIVVKIHGITRFASPARPARSASDSKW